MIVLSLGDLGPQGTVGNVQGHWVVMTWWEGRGATSSYREEVRDVAKQPVLHRPPRQRITQMSVSRRLRNPDTDTNS